MGTLLAVAEGMDKQTPPIEPDDFVAGSIYAPFADDPAELDNPNAGNPDIEPGDDDPDQRPVTDNKAGG